MQPLVLEVVLSPTSFFPQNTSDRFGSIFLQRAWGGGVKSFALVLSGYLVWRLRLHCCE